jgi:hypothetical protein
MEKEIANSNIRKEQELKELYNSLAHMNDKEAITAFFNLTRDDRSEKMKPLVPGGKKRITKPLMDFGKK